MFDPLSFNDFPAIMASETKEVPMGKRWIFGGRCRKLETYEKLKPSKKQQEFVVGILLVSQIRPSDFDG